MPPKKRRLELRGELLQLGDNGQLLECAACEKGGDLLRCCSCQHAFHPECAGYAGFDDVPVARSRWHCWYCAGAKGFKHPISKVAVKVGGKLLVGYTDQCQVYYLGEAVEVTREQVTVRYPHFPASEVERLPRTSKRLWHGTLDESSWQFDKTDCSYEPLSRCAPVDFQRLKDELAARQAAAAAAAEAVAAAPAAATLRAKSGVAAAAAAGAGGAASSSSSKRHSSKHAKQAQQAGVHTRASASPSVVSQLASGRPSKKQRTGKEPADSRTAAAAAAAGINKVPQQQGASPLKSHQQVQQAQRKAGLQPQQKQLKRQLPDVGSPAAVAGLGSGSKRRAEQPSSPPAAAKPSGQAVAQGSKAAKQLKSPSANVSGAAGAGAGAAAAAAAAAAMGASKPSGQHAPVASRLEGSSKPAGSKASGGKPAAAAVAADKSPQQLLKGKPDKPAKQQMQQGESSAKRPGEKPKVAAADKPAHQQQQQRQQQQLEPTKSPKQQRQPRSPAKEKGLQPKLQAGGAAAARGGSSTRPSDESSNGESSSSDESSSDDSASSDDGATKPAVQQPPAPAADKRKSEPGAPVRPAKPAAVGRQQGSSEESSSSSSEESSSSDHSSDSSSSDDSKAAKPPAKQQPQGQPVRAAAAAERKGALAATVQQSKSVAAGSPAKPGAASKKPEPKPQPKAAAAPKQQSSSSEEGSSSSEDSRDEDDSSSDGSPASQDNQQKAVQAAAGQKSAPAAAAQPSRQAAGAPAKPAAAAAPQRASDVTAEPQQLQGKLAGNAQQASQPAASAAQALKPAAAAQQQPSAPAEAKQANSKAAQQSQLAMPAQQQRGSLKRTPSALAVAAAAKKRSKEQQQQQQQQQSTASKGAEEAEAAAAAMAASTAQAAAASLSPQARLAQRLAAARGEALSQVQQGQGAYGGAYDLPDDLSDEEGTRVSPAKPRAFAGQQAPALAGEQPGSKALQQGAAAAAPAEQHQQHSNQAQPRAQQAQVAAGKQGAAAAVAAAEAAGGGPLARTAAGEQSDSESEMLDIDDRPPSRAQLAGPAAAVVARAAAPPAQAAPAAELGGAVPAQPASKPLEGASAPQPSVSEAASQAVAQAVAAAAVAAALRQEPAAAAGAGRGGPPAQAAPGKPQQLSQQAQRQRQPPGTQQATVPQLQLPVAEKAKPRRATPPPQGAGLPPLPQPARAAAPVAVLAPAVSGQQGMASAGNSATSGQLSGSRQPPTPWTQQEEDALLDAVRHLGVGKWQRVKDLKAAELSARSVEEIRAKWRSGLKQTSIVSPTRQRLPFPSPRPQPALGLAEAAPAAACGPEAAVWSGAAAAAAASRGVAARAMVAAAAVAAEGCGGAAAAGAAAAAAGEAAPADAEWTHPSAFPAALASRLRPTAAALALTPGQLLEVRGIEDDFRGGWALARVLQVHRGGPAGIASVDVEYCDFREEGEATNTREHVSFLHTTDDGRWVFPRIRLARHPAKPTGARPPSLSVKQAVEVFLHDVWWWGEVVHLMEQQAVVSVRFEPPPLGEGDLTSHPLVNVRPSTTDPGHGMVSLGPEAAEQGAAQASQLLPRAGAQSVQAPAAGVPGATAAVTATVQVAAGGAADARATVPATEGHLARSNSSLAGSRAAQHQAQLPPPQLPGQAQQQQQAGARQQRQPSAKDVFNLATRLFRSNVLGHH